MGDSTNQSVSILLVDRDEMLSIQVQEQLEREGFQCFRANDAAQALTIARSVMPSLMIIDTQLDACSGFDLARAIKNEYPRHEIPAIFVSESRSADLVAHSRRAGGIYFLGKPIDPSVLLELVDKALWMPHLIRRHIDSVGHEQVPRPSMVLSEAVAARVGTRS